MSKKIIVSKLGLKLRDIKKLPIVKEGKMKISNDTDTNFFIATNLTDEPVNFYRLGKSVAATLMIKQKLL